MKRIYTLFIALFLLPAAVLFAQKQTVTGIVKDENGNPLAGASIFEKQRGENGTTSNNKGEFIVTLNGKNKIIVVQFINYLTTEVNVQDKQDVMVKLSLDVKGMESVVVVGYGTQKKITKTGAISSISGDDIRLTPSASLQNTLIGRLPGFSSQLRSGRPGSDGATFYIRGISTFNGTGQPLILVDDIEFTYDQFATIDANDVESISILKDAATVAIYGIRGANGVVLVTTRKGKLGKPRVNISNQFAVTAPTKPAQYLNAYQSAMLQNEGRVNEGLPPKFSQADLDAFANHTDPYGHPDVDWYNTIFKKNSLMNTTNLDISGGTERVRYYISGGYLTQNGLLRHFKTKDNFNNNYYYRRYNFRSNFDIQATNSLLMKVNIASSFGETNSPVIPGAIANDPFFEIAGFQYLNAYAYPIYNPDGSYGWSNRNVTGVVGNNLVGRAALGGYTRSFKNTVNLNVSGVQKLDMVTKGLSIRGTIAYSTYNTAVRTLSRGTDFPSFDYNPLTQIYTPRSANQSRIQVLSLASSNGVPVRSINLQAAVNYGRQLANHNISFLGLVNQRADVATSADITLNNVPSKYRSYTGRLSYDFKQKYLLEFNGAYNGSDRFKSVKRYGFFPAVSAGWNIAEEGVVKKYLKFIGLLKIRGSWGKVGSDDIGSYKYIYQQIYSQTTNNYNFGTSPNSFNSIYEGQVGNTDVSWEKERKINAGMDFSLFEGKISGAVDIFDNYRYDILTTRGRIPVIFGQTLPVVNLGEVSNKGFEIELKYRANIGKLNYQVGGTYSVAKNKILFQDEPVPLFPWKQRTGKPIGLIGGGLYQFMGFYQDQRDIDASAKPAQVVRPGYIKYKDLNGDGVINASDQAFTGKPNLPQTIFAVNLMLNYKGVTLNALLQGAKDYNIRFLGEGIDAFVAQLQPVHLRRWQPGSGNWADYPALMNIETGVNSARDYPSDYWAIDAYYLRLRSLELAYNFPAALIKKIGFDGVRVYANGTNLITWSNVYDRYNYDPETQSGSDGRSLYPQQQIFNFGLSLSFK
jgi:TonB-linked SusC/RagA family outer membrane protein